MKLLEVKLIHIGPYNIEKIDFSTNHSKNVVLLCGENGAGKTTFLKAIKLGLFGGALLGFKQNSKSSQYIEEVKSIIRNNAKNASVEVTFSIVENYQEVVYKIKRQWNVTPTFSEKIDFYENDIKLENDMLIKKINYINNFYTPNVVDSIMFDGERILGLIDNGQLSSYVKDTILNLFGLNHYISLINDLDEYINGFIKEESLSIEQIQLTESERNYKIEKSKLIKEKEKLNSFQKLLELKNFIIEENIEVYSKLGGINKKDLSAVTKRISNIEKNREQNKNLVKSFLENNIIFLLNENNIKKCIGQIKAETPKKHIQNLNDLISSSILEKKDEEKLKDIIKVLSQNSHEEILLDLSKSDEVCFNGYLQEITEAQQVYKNLKHNNSSDLNLLKELKNKVSITQTDEMNELYDKISDELVKRDQIIQQIELSNEQIDLLNNNIEKLSDEVNELKRIVFEQTKENDSFVLAKKYQVLCQDYYEKEIARTLKLISDKCTKLIRNTYRKENYITRLEISNDFNVNIYKNKEKKNISQLSAGEKQLLVAAIISTIIKTSSRNIFVIFDTPAGRLDGEHMVRFYKNIMLDTASQVIIMPTSSEINDEVINSIYSSVSDCYTINYNEEGYSEIYRNKIFNKEWSK